MGEWDNLRHLPDGDNPQNVINQRFIHGHHIMDLPLLCYYWCIHKGFRLLHVHLCRTRLTIGRISYNFQMSACLAWTRCVGIVCIIQLCITTPSFICMAFRDMRAYCCVYGQTTHKRWHSQWHRRIQTAPLLASIFKTDMTVSLKASRQRQREL